MAPYASKSSSMNLIKLLVVLYMIGIAFVGVTSLLKRAKALTTTHQENPGVEILFGATK